MSGEERLTPQANPQNVANTNAVDGATFKLGSSSPPTFSAQIESPERTAHTHTIEIEKLRHEQAIQITKLNNQNRTVGYFLFLLILIVMVCLVIIAKPGYSSTMTTAAFGVIGTIVALIAGYVGGQKIG